MMTRRVVMNAVIENGKMELYFAAMLEDGQEQICKIRCSYLGDLEDPTKVAELEQDLNETNARALRDGIKSLGIVSARAIVPPATEVIRSVRPAGRREEYEFGPVIGTFKDNPIPSYIKVNDRTYHYSGLYQAGMKVDIENQMVDSGMIFEAEPKPELQSKQKIKR